MKYLLAVAPVLLLAACGQAQDTKTAQTPVAPQAEANAPETQAETKTFKSLTGEAPIIIAHRGASGLFPEHTIKAYETAIEQGADFIEPDLVMSSDGVLFANHDGYLSDTTDIADHPEFADRKKVRQTPFGDREDWWSDDFTWEELKTLKARQRVEGRDQEYNDQLNLVSFDEILDLVTEQAKKGRTVGLHIEAKWPSHFSSVGLDMVDPILDAMDVKGLKAAGIPVYIQCFEPQFLAEVAKKSDIPLIQNLIGPPYDKMLGMEISLDDVTTAGVGANKTMILNEDGTTTDYINQAHDKGLLVHVFTVRDDEPAPGFADSRAELRALFDAGADGVWTDYPGTAVDVLKNYETAEQ
ncbi:glycerophosphodiester phosphodiesterase family protein [Hyphomonas pacifica]|uniref:glycerophosphodiester phosphodiesterase n=1 Tax=Hyphomonas pacifica TaxID=1280941 RepID=A0A062U2U6_9PROT|nr:glycerophosphodiester phosphodiesterase family protein [Hyphomonas pacifica]KCZ52063.1 hypothetical protein HY2_10180 [Hyphomonas pacifica]RAN34653.1 hypothetical protein HY3_10110 [Hyphomonas pacifica]